MESTPTCPSCGQTLLAVGLHWVASRDDDRPEEHVQSVCPRPGCAFQACVVIDPGSAPASMYQEAHGAEMAVVEYLGLEPGELKAYGCHVRWSSWFESYLIVHPDEPDEDVFVLVIRVEPSYEICGWTMARGQAA